WLVECVAAAAADARLAEPHQLFSIRTELDHLHAHGSGLVGQAVRHPDVAAAVDVDAVREHHQAAAKTLEKLPRRPIELDDGREIRPLTGVGTAAIVGPDLS